MFKNLKKSILLTFFLPSEQAKTQNVLPKLLATVAKDGWELAGINNL